MIGVSPIFYWIFLVFNTMFGLKEMEAKEGKGNEGINFPSFG